MTEAKAEYDAAPNGISNNLDWYWHEAQLWDQYESSINALHYELVSQHGGSFGYVYAIEMSHPDPPEDGSVMLKIGRTRDPEQRLKAIQKTSVIMPYSLDFWAVWFAEDAVRAESEMHALLKHLRVNGEWFRIPQAMLEGLHWFWYFTTPEHPDSVVSVRERLTGRIDDPEKILEYVKGVEKS